MNWDDALEQLGFVSSGPLPTIEHVRSKLGLPADTLPQDYMDFLIQTGGGCFQTDVACRLLAPPGYAENGRWPVDHFLTLDDGPMAIVDWLASAAGDEIVSQSYFPCAAAPGGDLYCVALTSNQQPGVVLWEHETGVLVKAAASFLHFVRQLELDDTDVDDIDLDSIKLTLDPDLE